MPTKRQVNQMIATQFLQGLCSDNEHSSPRRSKVKCSGDSIGTIKSSEGRLKITIRKTTEQKALKEGQQEVADIESGRVKPAKLDELLNGLEKPARRRLPGKKKK